MDINMQPQLMNNIDMQPQQEQKNMEQMDQNLMNQNLMNQNLMMEPQGNQQMQGNNLQASLLRTETILKPVDAEAVQESRELHRAAEVEFQRGINSRPGSCERRKTKRKKAAMRTRIERTDGMFARGLTEHSGKLSDDLIDVDLQEKEQQQENNKFYDKWAESGAGKLVRLTNDAEGFVPVEEHKEQDAYKIPLLGWLKDDKSRENLLSREYLLRGRAYEELLDRAMEFQLQPNALCTLPAMQRAAEVMRFAPLVNNLQSTLEILPTQVKNHLPPYKLEQFEKFQLVFSYLQEGTEVTANLQGINANGKTRHNTYSVMTANSAKDIQNDYDNSRQQRNDASADYERELAQYNASYSDKEALRQRRLEYIEQSTGVPLSEKVFDIMRDLREIQGRVSDKVAVVEMERKFWSPSKTEKESLALMDSADYKREVSGGVLTAEEKKVMARPAHIAAIKLSHYIETEEEREMLFSKTPELRAVQAEKTIDRLLKKLPHPMSDDPSVYSCTKDVQASAAMVDLTEDISQVNILLFFDPFSVQHIAAEKTEQMNNMLAMAMKFAAYENLSAGIMGLTTKGAFSDGDVGIDGDRVTLNKEQMITLQAQQAELYKQEVQKYNEYHENSDPQSLQKIAEAQKLLGTDIGVTKHTLEMAETLREPQSIEQQLQDFKGVRLLDSRTNEAMAAAQVRMMDKLMEFPLDATQVSITPDMENIPQIIAHGRLIDEAKRQIAEDKAMRQMAEEKSGGKNSTELLIPADKLAQWEEFNEVFTTLRDTAAIAVGRVGLTVDGNSRYADKPDITPEELAADKSQLSRAYTDGHTKLELVGRSYASKYLASEESKQQAKEAEKLLGTSFGITIESYKLATTLQSNQKQAETNAAADKQWFDAWSESEEGKRQIADSSSLAEKKAAHASKLEELKKESASVRSAILKQHYIDNPDDVGKTINTSRYPEIKALEEKVYAYGRVYVPTEEEKKQLPLSAHKPAAQVLHLLEGDDKAKLFSEDPKQRAEVLTAMAEKLVANDLDKEQLTDTALVQKLPELMANEKDAKALSAVLDEDAGAEQFISRALISVVYRYAGATRRASQAAPHILQAHGLSANGNSLYKGHEPKDVQDYRQISAEKVLHGLRLSEVNEKFTAEYNSFVSWKDDFTVEKEKQAKEKLEKERLENERLVKEKLAQEKKLYDEKLEQERQEQDKLKKEQEDVLTQKEREDFARRKDMSPQDAKKDMVEDSKKWLANWEESEEGKTYKQQQGVRSDPRFMFIMSKKQSADATKLAHLLTDTQRSNLFSINSTMRSRAGRELYHIIMGDTEIKKRAPQEERDKVKVQQDVAKLETIENAKALLRLAKEESYSFITPRQTREMLELLQQ